MKVDHMPKIVNKADFSIPITVFFIPIAVLHHAAGFDIWNVNS
jgi:hypothetical protein